MKGQFNVKAAHTNNVGSFSCVCNTACSVTGVACSDVNKCYAETDNFDMNDAHKNTKGRSKFTCSTGLNGGGITCINNAACDTDDDCDGNSSCDDISGELLYACNDAYTENG